jgi:hypothetical protein
VVEQPSHPHLTSRDERVGKLVAVPTSRHSVSSILHEVKYTTLDCDRPQRHFVDVGVPCSICVFL